MGRGSPSPWHTLAAKGEWLSRPGMRKIEAVPFSRESPRRLELPSPSTRRTRDLDVVQYLDGLTETETARLFPVGHWVQGTVRYGRCAGSGLGCLADNRRQLPHFQPHSPDSARQYAVPKAGNPISSSPLPRLSRSQDFIPQLPPDRGGLGTRTLGSRRLAGDEERVLLPMRRTAGAVARQCHHPPGRAAALGPGSPRRHVAWRRHSRRSHTDLWIVRSNHGRNAVVLTGVGFIEELHLLASSDPTVSYLEFADTASLDAHALRSTSDDEWIFNFHSACWDLLLDRVLDPYGPDRSEEVARNLFDLLYCLPFDRHRTPIFGHDFGGALRFRDVLGPPPIQKYITLGCSFMLFDPLETGAAAMESVAEIRVPDIFFSPATPYAGEDVPGDVFSHLPNELALLMLSHLASSDVANLRLASRTIAHISHPAHLPQSFWESRFIGDFEMGYFFCGIDWPERRSDVDWRSLYGRLRMIEGSRLTQQVRNRRRVWLTLAHLVNPLRCMLGREAPITTEAGLRDPCLPSGYWPGPEVRSDSLAAERLESPEGIHAGVRVFEKFCLPFPTMSRAEHVKIGVSLLPFDGEEYVCGLRVGPPREFASTGTTSQVGIIRSSTERELWLSYGDHVDSIDVATTISGIVGLRFHVQRAGGSRVDFTAGSLDQSTTKVGVASLIPPGDGAVDGVIIGLDVGGAQSAAPWVLPVTDTKQAFKFVSIRLIEPQSTLSSVPDGAGVQNLRKDVLTNMATLWSPKCPRQDGTVRLPASHLDKQRGSPSDGSSFCLNIDFGGCAAAKLPLLNRITATLDRSPGLFKGFGFSYDDGTEEFFGIRSGFQNASSQRTCVEMSFPVAGKDGELVTEIGVRTRSSGSNARVGAIVVGWRANALHFPFVSPASLGDIADRGGCPTSSLPTWETRRLSSISPSKARPCHYPTRCRSTGRQKDRLSLGSWRKSR